MRMNLASSTTPNTPIVRQKLKKLSKYWCVSLQYRQEGMAKTPHASFPLGSCKLFTYCSKNESLTLCGPIIVFKKTRYSHKRRREQDQRRVGRKSRPVEM
jgi:hypothetical protein